jgi:hypothetical protein
MQLMKKTRESPRAEVENVMVVRDHQGADAQLCEAKVMLSLSHMAWTKMSRDINGTGRLD